MTSTHDVNGRAYLKLFEAKEELVELDDGFTCRKAGPAMLFRNDFGLYFHCDHGKHYIDGLDVVDDGIHCVGIYPLRTAGSDDNAKG